MGATCGCGSTGGTSSNSPTGSCGCGGSTAKITSTAPTNPITRTTTQKPRGASPECEPTAICESYSFDVFLAPDPPKRGDKKQLQGPLIEAFLCCLRPLQDALPKIPTRRYAEQPTAWNLWCCRVKAALIGYFTTGPQANCLLASKASALVCPDPKPRNFQRQMRLTRAAALLIEAMPLVLGADAAGADGTSDDRVPLAVVTVRAHRSAHGVQRPRCARRSYLPGLEYWLTDSWLVTLGDIIGALCCGELKTRTPDRPTPYHPNPTVPAAGAPAATADATMMHLNSTLDAERTADNQTLTALPTSALARAKAPIDPEAVLGGVFGFPVTTSDPLSAAEKANIAPFVLLNEVLLPIAATIAPATVAGETPMHVADTVTGDDTTASLYERIATLEAAVKDLQSV